MTDEFGLAIGLDDAGNTVFEGPFCQTCLRLTDRHADWCVEAAEIGPDLTPSAFIAAATPNTEGEQA